MQKGKINVTTENIFPIIKKFLYSDHEIFLRELVSNAVDATQKLKTLASIGEFKAELGDQTIQVELNEKKKTLKIIDKGIGMTAEEVEKYITQIAFSSAEEFLEKYKEQNNAIIGHFGLGFYSAFMVSEKVELVTKSHQEGAKAVKWVCDGSPEYSIEEVEKDSFGTEVTLFIDDDSKEFLEKGRVSEILNKYCKFLPVEIAFGKETDWKDGKEVETDKLNIINDPKPLWTVKPADAKEEDYNNFYNKLYTGVEAPLFNIHLNVDYPFNLTGILYFPKIKNNIEIQKNKIQLYSNQVFVTDSVEGIVPEFLTLLHGVLDSPDIPLNVSRSYLQSDSNVKKISNHIMKKVADRLEEIFKEKRTDFESKWDDLKLFITYGMISEEKFYEKAEKFALLKNTDNKYFTFEEYKELIKANQTDKNKSIVHLYSTDKEAQHSFIEKAKSKGYDVILLDGQLDAHFVNQLEQKMTDCKFIRVDADIVDKLIEKDDAKASHLTEDQKSEMSTVFESANVAGDNYIVSFEALGEQESPVIITQNEFMRRMKDMSQLSGGADAFYGSLPNSYNLVINSDHQLVNKLIEQKDKKLSKKLEAVNEKISPLKEEDDNLKKSHEKLKDEEIPQADKDKLAELEKEISSQEENKKVLLKEFGTKSKLAKQMIDLSLLANNMLSGEALTNFVKRSEELIK
ncbi:MAG: molecular chaperone HtpG [Bacteroidales bacterium]|nr:molecular chaperone HtpG [Bacteroidales bacterium]